MRTWGTKRDTGTPDDQANYSADNDQISDEEGVLDQDGKLTIHFKTTLSEHRFDYRYRIEARVTDEAKREISGTGSVIATYGSFLVNVEPNRYFYEPDTQGTFTVQARDYDNKPVQTKARVELLLVELAGATTTARRSRRSTDVNTGADGSAVATIPIPTQAGIVSRAGHRAHAGSAHVEQYTYIWVAGAGVADWFGAQAENSPDRSR